MPRGIELVVRRDIGPRDAPPKFSVYAGGQRVGSVYQVNSGRLESWVWSMDGITVDTTASVPTRGYADSIAFAAYEMRAAVERWLERARALPREDLKYPLVAVELMTMGFPKFQPPNKSDE